MKSGSSPSAGTATGIESSAAVMCKVASLLSKPSSTGRFSVSTAIRSDSSQTEGFSKEPREEQYSVAGLSR